MIADLIVGLMQSVLTTVLSAVAGLVPAVPGFSTGLTYVGAGIDLVRSFDTWIPVTFAFLVVGAVLACYATAWVLGALRMVISYMTFGGGST